MSTKEILREVSEKLPPDATLADAIYELEFRQGVEQGLAELDRGEGVPLSRSKGRLPNGLESDCPVTELLPLSLLNDFLYCPRRAALKIVEGWRDTNEHTARGDIVHEHADLPGYEVANGVKLLRALPVWSDRLGVNGKCDLVEVHPLAADASGAANEGLGTLYPVEFKLGRRRQWENDDAQLCAQALCLEEMFAVTVPRGAIFHADSKRRREVEFTAELRRLTENAVAGVHALLEGFEIANLRFEIPRLPAAVFKPACEQCSLFETCLPKATGADGRAQRLALSLFKI
jgi:CRISPR-associated exonuclease Cas4